MSLVGTTTRLRHEILALSDCKHACPNNATTIITLSRSGRLRSKNCFSLVSEESVMWIRGRKHCCAG